MRALPSPYGEEQKAQLALYDDVVADGGWLIAVAVRRTPSESEHGRTVPMSSKDPSTWFSYGGVLLVWIALLPWWWDDGLHVSGLIHLLATAFVAGLLIALNWVIGGMWAKAISSLGLGQLKLPFWVDVGDLSAAEERTITGGALLSAALILVVLVLAVTLAHSYLGV
jgi:hypothetical protein